MACWLFKSEPHVYSIDDLAREKTGVWEGVRNYQARNFLRDGVRVGDTVLFYHSSCKVPAIVGLAEVVRAAYPDPAQFDPRSAYHDPKASPEQPRWVAVDVAFRCKLARPVSRDDLRACPELADMALLRRGQRLSILPITESEWQLLSALMAAGASQA